MKKISDDLNDEGDSQAFIWLSLRGRILRTLGRFGMEEDQFGAADYLLVEDNLGHRWHTIEIHRLHMLEPRIVKSLQSLLREAPNWEIIIAVDIPGAETAWPPMGLTIRSDEIIDGLQRQYFPREFRDIRYEGSRPGTDRD